MGNRTCATCGGPLVSEYATIYCSQECFHEGHSFAGEAHPNFQGKRETTACRICGTEFEYYPSEMRGLFCPDCVRNEPWREPPPPMSGADNPRWGGGKVELTCPVCGDTFERYPSEVNDGENLCSNHCRSAWLSESFSGEGHPNWKGGGNEPYGKGWARVRERALERDGYRCVVCGATKEEIGRNPDVHHIVPVRAFVDDEDRSREDAHRLENVASLCVGCHRRADFGAVSRAELRSLIGE